MKSTARRADRHLRALVEPAADHARPRRVGCVGERGGDRRRVGEHRAALARRGAGARARGWSSSRRAARRGRRRARPTAASASAAFSRCRSRARCANEPGCGAGGERAAVDALHEPLRRELAQVAPDRVLGHAELVDEPRGDDLPVARRARSRIAWRRSALEAAAVPCTFLHERAWYCMNLTGLAPVQASFWRWRSGVISTTFQASRVRFIARIDPGGRVELPPAQAVHRGARERVVVVVPGLAEREQREPEDVRRVVVDGEAARAEEVADGVDRPGDVVQQEDPHRAAPERAGQPVGERPADRPAERRTGAAKPASTKSEEAAVDHAHAAVLVEVLGVALRRRHGRRGRRASPCARTRGPRARP